MEYIKQIIIENNKAASVQILDKEILYDAVKYGDSTSFEATVLDNVDTIKAFYWEKNSFAPFIGTYVVE